MKRSQREILMKLMIYCDKSDCDILNYHIGGGTQATSDKAEVIYKDGSVWSLYYNIGHGDWMEKPDDTVQELITENSVNIF